MAEVTANISIKGEGKLVEDVAILLEAILDNWGGYDVLPNDNKSVFEVEVSSAEQPDVNRWIRTIQKVLNENNVKGYHLDVEGSIDEDYGCYTEFELECTPDVLRSKSAWFQRELPPDDLDMDDLEDYWMAEFEENHEAFEHEEYIILDDSNVHISDREYEIVNNAYDRLDR